MRKLSWLRLAILLAPPVAVLTYVVVVAPLPSRSAGHTRCMPITGPIVMVDSALSLRDRSVALAHEGVHADQCKRDGFVLNYVGRLSRRGRMNAELPAFCAEARTDVALGGRADHVVARVLDELEEAYPWFRGTTRLQFLAGLERYCGDVIAQARQRAARPLA